MATIIHLTNTMKKSDAMKKLLAICIFAATISFAFVFSNGNAQPQSGNMMGPGMMGSGGTA